MVLFRRSAARDPGTDPTTLSRLARNSNPKVVEAVAGNPSTPPTTLAELAAAKSLPTQIALAGNHSTPAAVLDELAKKNGSLYELKVAVASNPSSSPQTLEWILKPPPVHSSPEAREIARAVAGNRASSTLTRARLFQVDHLRDIVLRTQPLETVETRITLASSRPHASVLDLLSHDPSDEVRRAVAIASRESANYKTLDRLARDPSPRVANVAIALRTTDPALLASLSSSDDQLVLAGIARNPATPADCKPRVARALIAMANDTNTLGLLARDKTTPTEVLNKLAAHPNAFIRRALVSNPSAPPEAFQALSDDPESDIRTVAATSSSLPLETVVSLATDKESIVRAAVAANSSTPPGVLTRLATDSEMEVRAAVAANASTPTDALTRLAADSEMEVLLPLAKHPQVTAANLQQIVDRVTRRHNWENESPSRPADPSVPLGSSRSPRDVIRAVAANPSSPAKLLDEIARMVNKQTWAKAKTPGGGRGLELARETILKAVAANPSSSVETLQFLSRGDWVSRRIREVTEKEIYGSWKEWDTHATKAFQEDTASWVRGEISRRRWTGTEDRETRQAIAGTVDTASAILDELAQDSDESVRRAVAANPSTSPQAFAALADDPADAVRAAAAGATHPDPASAKYERTPSWRRRQREEDYHDSFERLARDASPEVRAALVANAEVLWKTLTTSSLERLALDPDPHVRAAVGASYVHSDSWTTTGLSTTALTGLLDIGDLEVWQQMARRSDSPDIWERLAEVSDASTTTILAKHLPADSDVLLRLAESRDSEVISAFASRTNGPTFTRIPGVTRVLARNPATPPMLLERIARQSEDDDTLESALRNPAISEEFLDELATGADERPLRALALLENMRVNRLIAENPSAPVELLESLAGMGDTRVRHALLSNKTTPPSLLLRLVQDEQTRQS